MFTHLPHSSAQLQVSNKLRSCNPPLVHAQPGIFLTTNLTTMPTLHLLTPSFSVQSFQHRKRARRSLNNFRNLAGKLTQCTPNGFIACQKRCYRARAERWNMVEKGEISFLTSSFCPSHHSTFFHLPHLCRPWNELL